MRVILFPAVVQVLLGLATAYGSEDYCVDGIRTDLDQFVFKGGSPEDYWGNICANNLSVTSMWATAKTFCTEKEILSGEATLGEYCTEYGNVTLIPYGDILPALTDDFVKSLQVVEFEDIDPTIIWNNSVLLSKAFYVAGERTVSVFEFSYTLDQRYGWGIYGFWGIILVAGMANRLLTYMFRARRTPVLLDVEGHQAPASYSASKWPLEAIQHWLRTNLVIPAAFGTHHQRLFYSCTVPTRMETVVVVAFYILNLLLCCVSYDIFYPNLYYTRAMQAWRYIADRTGIISYANLPILWMFSGRNNVFLWLTGWSFSTFNIFHRHVARIATIQAIVHSICYTALEANYGYLAESWTEHYWYMGGMATIVMSLLLVFSSIWIRQRFYELFLIIHIALSVLTIVGLYYHTAIFEGAYDPYLWPLVAIWVFDRVARFVRLAYCNLHLKLSDQIVGTKTVATYDKEANLVRLEVTPGSKILKARAGQHYFLYQPLKWKGWENHPFTLAAWKSANGSIKDNSVAEDIQGSRDATFNHESKGKGKEIQVTGVDTPTTSGPSSDGVSTSSSEDAEVMYTSTTTSQDTLIFYIRPFSSWTMRLRDECIKSPTSSVNASVLLEGPYGEHSNLNSFENVILITGGTGISGALPYLHEFLASVSSSSKANVETGRTQSKRGTCTKQVTLIWTTKQSAMIRSVSAQELKPFIGHASISTHFYATSRHESPAAVEHDNLEKVNSLDNGFGLGISYGRPNVRKSVLGIIDEVHAAGPAGGRIAISTCGPAAMADEARAAVHTAMKQGKRGVEYFEEAFGW